MTLIQQLLPFSHICLISLCLRYVLICLEVSGGRADGTHTDTLAVSAEAEPAPSQS